MPRGNMLPETVWSRRHALITWFALTQALCLGAAALVSGRTLPDAIEAVLVPGLPALVALRHGLGRSARTLSTVSSLMFSSAVLVGLTDGLTEAHFHFFVMVGLTSLYQDWAAFGTCVLVTVLHHGVMGLLAPANVYSSRGHQQHPIGWAAVHGGFILAASVTHMIAWKLNEQQELRDPLTRLPNRTSFNLELSRLCTATSPVSVLFIDIDDFKTINDTYGHQVGDAALVHAAVLMQQAVRRGDVVARLSGDEFAVLLRSGNDTAAQVAKRICSRLKSALVLEGRTIVVSASIGTVDGTVVDSRDGEVLMRAADHAMYAAKSAGRGLIMSYSVEMEETSAQRARMARDLGAAVADERLLIHYQPIIDARTGRTIGVEALLRWDHPDLGTISPVDFIAIAEQTGHILAIGEWVLHEACRAVAGWQRSTPGGGQLNLAVNLSALQLRDPDLIDHVRAALSGSGLAPHDLTLEVTETSILEDLDLARVRLEGIRALGVCVAIDDFGTGYSSLSYLANLPLDKIKIDSTFVGDIADNGRTRALVRCIVDMSQALGLQVLAEGVETVEQELTLHELGCRWWQGFLHAAPAHEADVPSLLALTRPVPNDISGILAS